MSLPINPRIRALGKARIDVTRRAASERDWQQMWHPPRYALPFRFSGWKYAVQYFVDDYAAEIGFYIDVLGFPVEAFSPSFARFTTPDGDFYFTVAAAPEGYPASEPTSIRFQLMVEDLEELLEILEQRGVVIERVNAPQVAVPMLHACLYSPHGICIELWALVEVKAHENFDAPLPIEPVAVQGEYGGVSAERDHVDDFFQAETDDELEFNEGDDTNEDGDDPGGQPASDVLEITYEDIDEEEKEAPLMAQSSPPPPPESLTPIPPGSGRSQLPLSRTHSWDRRTQPQLKSNRLEADSPTMLQPASRTNGRSPYPNSGLGSGKDHNE